MILWPSMITRSLDTVTSCTVESRTVSLEIILPSWNCITITSTLSPPWLWATWISIHGSLIIVCLQLLVSNKLTMTKLYTYVAKIPFISRNQRTSEWLWTAKKVKWWLKLLERTQMDQKFFFNSILSKIFRIKCRINCTF